MSGRDKSAEILHREHGFEQFALEAILLLEEHGSRELLRQRAPALAVSQKILPGRARSRTHLERAVRKEALVLAGDHRILKDRRKIVGIQTGRANHMLCGDPTAAHMLELAGG